MTHLCMHGQGFLAEGLQRTSAGLGSVIIDSQPLTVAALAALLLGERLRPAGVAGLAVGVAGLCLLEAPPDLIMSLPAVVSGGLLHSDPPFFLFSVCGVTKLSFLDAMPTIVARKGCNRKNEVICENYSCV